MNNYKYPILAKPSGITLEQHVEDVMLEGRQLAENFPFTHQKYYSITSKSLEKRVEWVAKLHDDGKIHEKWQNACQLDYDNYSVWKSKNNGSFQGYANANNEEVGKNLRKVSLRHEFQSLANNENKKLPVVLQAAIAAHHSKLGHKYEDRWVKEGVERFWKLFKKESNKAEELNLRQIAKLHYEFAGPRGFLQLSDHRASAIEDGEFVPAFKQFTYKFPHDEKRSVQKIIESCWNEDLLLIRAPTGAGKTDAALLWASKQIENKKAERLVIAMPTRFTSNALAINVAESLSDTGLYHSSAWFTRFQSGIETGEIKKKQADKIHEFARLLITPVTVCTIDHLLISLTLTREDHHLIAFNLANSCVVIDEADFYDDFTQANMCVLLEILKYWEVPVLLMSASLPESMLPLYQKIGFRVNKIHEDVSDNQRTRFEIKSINNYCDIVDIEDLLELCVKNGNAIIYANTLDRALEIYKWFKNKSVEALLYHSRFTEPHKKDKEVLLIEMLGRESWEKKQANGIAILTQIGEMSINISADIMISELCPIDRLTQRAGRLCRFDKSKIGQLYVIVPEKKSEIYPAPYGEFDRKTNSWQPAFAFSKTHELLKIGKYSSEKLVTFLNLVYPETTQFSPIAKQNARNLKDYFTYNWLINSKEISSKDNTNTNYWTSRNIAPQETIYVSYPDKNFFNNYLDFQSWKLENSIEMPVYLIERGKRNNMIDSVQIYFKEEQITILVVREGFYNFETGISFIETDQII